MGGADIAARVRRGHRGQGHIRRGEEDPGGRRRRKRDVAHAREEDQGDAPDLGAGRRGHDRPRRPPRGRHPEKSPHPI